MRLAGTPWHHYNGMDVIETDLDRMNPAACSAPPTAGYPASVASAVPPPHVMEPAATDDSGLSAHVVIMEQPASKALRFRYECEGRSAGSLPGARSTAERKTHPSIAVLGYRGPAVVVVSCVTKDHPYRPHPHNLVGKDGCKKGVCTLNINVDTMSLVFFNLGIQCVKKKDVDDSLKLRESIRVDPFQTGFEHRKHQSGIDLNAVRLCFQVFLEGDKPGQFCVPLKPVVSEPIYDKKSMCELAIYKMSDCCASVAGGRDIILLCDKVAKDDIEIRFFEVQDQQLVWEGFGEFQPADVHRQVAIAFKTPRYINLEVESPVRVQIQLRRLSDRQSSEPRPFHFTPVDTDGVDEKKRKMSRNSERVQQYLPDNSDGYSANNTAVSSVRPRTRSPGRARHRSVKREPTDIGSPDHFPAVSVLSPQSVIAGGLSPGGLSPGGLSPGHVALGDCQSPGRSPAAALGVASPASPAHPECLAGQYPTALSPHQYIKSEPARRGYAVSHAPATPAAPASPKLSNVPLELPQELDLGVPQQQQEDHIELDMGRLTSEDFRMLSFPSDLNLQAINDHLSQNLSQQLNLLDEPSAAAAEAAQPLAASTAAAGDVRMDSGQLDSLTRNTISQLKELNTLSRK